MFSNAVLALFILEIIFHLFDQRWPTRLNKFPNYQHHPTVRSLCQKKYKLPITMFYSLKPSAGKNKTHFKSLNFGKIAKICQALIIANRIKLLISFIFQLILIYSYDFSNLKHDKIAANIRLFEGKRYKTNAKKQSHFDIIKKNDHNFITE